MLSTVGHERDIRARAGSSKEGREGTEGFECTETAYK
jgi:hypothetical protein